MSLSFGIEWGGTRRARTAVAVLAVVLLGAVPAGRPAVEAATTSVADLVSVIVRERAGAGGAAERRVEDLGGTVGRDLDLINGFQATVPADRLAALAASPTVESVTRNGRVRLLHHKPEHVGGNGKGNAGDLGSLNDVARMVGADVAAAHGITGAGVDVAVIDSGVVPLPELSGRILNGPDLSFESPSGTDPGAPPPPPAPAEVAEVAEEPAVEDEPVDAPLVEVVEEVVSLVAAGTGRVVPWFGTGATTDLVTEEPLPLPTPAAPPTYLDTFGHGTHIAGIIAGNGPGFRGIAPGARIINVKVASADGATDVSQVIAAIDWVVTHRNDPGMDIRVLNLSFGTDSDQSYLLDPLAYAVEQAWHQGIVVVAAAGNEGFGSPRLNNPAADPFVIAVGSSDHVGTLSTLDDAVSDFSSRGVAERRPDVVAPGRSVVSLRNPGSFIDTMFPNARVGTKYFRGTGTSQSAAVVSGAAALLLQQRPDLRPDQVKALLMATAQKVKRADPLVSGEGLIKVDRALSIPTWAVKDHVQTYEASTGTGSLEAARGSIHVADPATGEELRGEYDWFGRSWTGGSWSGGSWSGGSWSGASWSGGSWSGGSWSGGSWSGGSWSGGSWSGGSWSGGSWSGGSWSGGSWSGGSWSGGSWSGGSWSGGSWSGGSWSGGSWSGGSWSGGSWSGGSWSGGSWSGGSWSGGSWSGGSWSGGSWSGGSWSGGSWS